MLQEAYTESTVSLAETTSENVSAAGNVSFPKDCREIFFEGFIPWNNSDSVISYELEALTQRLKAAIILPLLFLFGGPANVINMAVFYKQGLRERINLCLFAMSLSDLLYLTHCMFLNGEEIHRQFWANSRFGPLFEAYSNWNLTGFYGFGYVSYVISAIIACERCFCVVSPLRSQTVLTTRTMAIVLILVFVVVTGGYFVVGTRYRVGCSFERNTGIVFLTFRGSSFYDSNQTLVDYLDSILYGVALPSVVIVLVTTSTAVTGFKLQQAAVWRSETSTAATSLSARQVALTKMLIASAVLFIVCITPIFLVKFSQLFVHELSSGRRQQNLYLFLLWVCEIFSYVNSSVNIVVYYIMGSRYRLTFCSLLGNACKCKPPIDNDVNNKTAYYVSTDYTAEVAPREHYETDIHAREGEDFLNVIRPNKSVVDAKAK